MDDQVKIIGDPLPNIPWEEKPEGCREVIWRYSRNPIIGINPVPSAQSIYNSAVHPFKGQFVGVFRADSRSMFPYLHLGRSQDALRWEIEDTPIQMECADAELSRVQYQYDPRVVKIEDTFYVTWCNGYHGPTIGVAETKDFKRFKQLENAFLPFNRNGVLFPKKINGKYMMLSRPSDNGHTPFGDIYLSESPDMVHWGRHRFVMGAGGQWWQSTKIGAGPVPIETTAGWLLIYHGVLNTCNGFVYNFGAAVLDSRQPRKVLFRTNKYLLTPETEYEQVGKVPNVAFPCAALVDPPTGRMAIYYGAADTCTAVAFTRVEELFGFIVDNSTVF
jgi:beta-1,4-mannooligosaccharide/beta-1,4-mannosyl-N-acetylglucosamine phosphorylase